MNCILYLHSQTAHKRYVFHCIDSSFSQFLFYFSFWFILNAPRQPFDNTQLQAYSQIPQKLNKIFHTLYTHVTIV